MTMGCRLCDDDVYHINQECFFWGIGNAYGRPRVNLDIEAMMPAGFCIKRGSYRGNPR